MQHATVMNNIPADLPLSVILVSFDMEREIPRTIHSLSESMQKEIHANEYELILVDNGSENTKYLEALKDLYGNLHVLQVEKPDVSPSRAVNLGLQHARGELIGVLIDGARMASPRLLINALRAAKLHHRPVVASLGFHLGDEVQMDSVHKGYNQDAENQLLDSVDWQANGYRLFDISVFAGSSSGGWFAPIAESNALFMNRDMWNELDGYDVRFRSSGGGLVNLDTFKRACELPDSQLIILLGEGTFHQFHGGVSTNAKCPPINKFMDEYNEIRGVEFRCPDQSPWYFGCHEGIEKCGLSYKPARLS